MSESVGAKLKPNEVAAIGVGDVLWTWAYTIESESCYDNDPHQPWRVKVTEVTPWGAIRASYVGNDGEIDEDSNATVQTNSRWFAADEQEAWRQYERCAASMIDRAVNEAKKWAEEAQLAVRMGRKSG